MIAIRCIACVVAGLVIAGAARAEHSPARWSLVGRVFGEERAVGVTRGITESWEGFVTLQAAVQQEELDQYDRLQDLDLDMIGVAGELGAWVAAVHLGGVSILVGPSCKLWLLSYSGTWTWSETGMPASGRDKDWTADLGVRVGIEAPLIRGLSVLISDRPIAVRFGESRLVDDMSWFAERSPYRATSHEALLELRPTLGLRLRF